MPDGSEAYVEVPNHVIDRNGNVWRVVRDGGMVTRADYDGVKSCGIEVARREYGPLRPIYEAAWRAFDGEVR